MKIKQILFLIVWSRGLLFQKESKLVQEVIGDVCCPGKYCFKREKCKSFDGYVSTPRSIYGCRKCGAWLIVHKNSFTLQEHVKTTKTEKLRFFYDKKFEILVPNKQLFIIVPFQSTKYRKKILCEDSNVQETIGDAYCPTWRNEKYVYISTNKTSSFYDCKKCKACSHVLNTPFKDQKLTIMLFGGDGTHCFARKTSGDYKNEKPSPILKTFLHQSQSSIPDLEPKMVKILPITA